MSGFGLEVLGEEVVELKLARAAAAGASGVTLERALVAGALPPTNRAKELCKKKTGNLARSIHIGGHQGLTGGLRGSTGTHGGTSGTNIGGNAHGKGYAVILVGTNVFYAIPVEYGTSAHEIRPVNKKALWWPGAAHPVSVVHHPGTPPSPYMRPAFDGAGPEIAEVASHVLIAAIEAGLA